MQVARQQLRQFEACKASTEARARLLLVRLVCMMPVGDGCWQLQHDGLLHVQKSTHGTGAADRQRQ
jgi:hypothetical protein